jgi:hypothetical protein
MPEKWLKVSDANPWRKLPYALLLASLLVFGFFPRLLTDKIKPVTEQIVATVRADTTVASNLKANIRLTSALSPSQRERENRSQSLDKSIAGGTDDDFRANESGRLPSPPRGPRSSGRESAPSSFGQSQSRLTSAATVQGFNARNSFSGNSLPGGEDQGEGERDVGDQKAQSLLTSAAANSE